MPPCRPRTCPHHPKLAADDDKAEAEIAENAESPSESVAPDDAAAAQTEQTPGSDETASTPTAETPNEGTEESAEKSA